MELPKSKSAQPRYSTTRVTLYSLPVPQAMPTTLSVTLIGDGVKFPVDKTTGNPPKALSPLMMANWDRFAVS